MENWTEIHVVTSVASVGGKIHATSYFVHLEECNSKTVVSVGSCIPSRISDIDWLVPGIGYPRTTDMDWSLGKV